MEQILKALQEMEKRVNKKFDDINGRFDGVNRQFDDINGKFDGINRQFDGVNGKFNMVTEQLDRMEATLNAVAQTANDDTVTILERIDRNTKNLNQDIEFLSEQVGKHEMFFNRINKN